jgi:hypothetical protein
MNNDVTPPPKLPTSVNDSQDSAQDVDVAKKLASAAAPFIPKEIKAPVQKFAQKLTDASNGADATAVNLDEALVKGLDHVEKKLNNFLDGLDSFLGKF